ncbi:MAG: PD40 domain-containing protein [Phycisphaerae bacterium]|jgi:TolB protein
MNNTRYLDFAAALGAGLPLMACACRSPAIMSSPVEPACDPPREAWPGTLDDAGSVARSALAEAARLGDLRQHTYADAGDDFDPDVSRDGGRLAFVSTRRGGCAEIFVQTVGARDATPLTDDGADAIQPRFSPDGTRIAFASLRSGNWDIWVMNSDGTSPRRLTYEAESEISPCWSPDGEEIAYSAWNERTHRWEIHAVRGGVPHQRRRVADGMLPAWSPDGSLIAYQSEREPGSRSFVIWTIDAAGVGPPREVAASTTAACVAPCWSPDGRWVGYSQRREIVEARSEAAGEDSACQLWAVEVSSGRKLPLLTGESSSTNAAWTHDGRVFFVRAVAGGERVYSGTIAALGTESTEKPKLVRNAAASGGDGASRIAHRQE